MERLRLLLAAAVLALLAVVGFAPHAAAQEEDHSSEGTEAESHDPVHTVEEMVEENGGTEFDAHCVALLAEGKSVEDCQEAPNPLLPETNEILWGTFGFAVVFIFLWKFGYPAMKKSMNDRTERIRSDLASAESQRTEADALLADYRSKLSNAQAESGRIIEEARQSADALRRDQEARLQTELAELRSRAAADIDAAKTQAIADLRGEVAQLAIGAAEVVVKRNLDQATQTQLIEDYINQVGAR
ncbi:MAG: F0F1 ATP synthase subunit B [Actinomycetota bacterium]|nr:F0F1 ATP synthase subunit B [Actinomycetota bacterium]